MHILISFYYFSITFHLLFLPIFLLLFIYFFPHIHEIVAPILPVVLAYKSIYKYLFTNTYIFVSSYFNSYQFHHFYYFIIISFSGGDCTGRIEGEGGTTMTPTMGGMGGEVDMEVCNWWSYVHLCVCVRVYEILYRMLSNSPFKFFFCLLPIIRYSLFIVLFLTLCLLQLFLIFIALLLICHFFFFFLSVCLIFLFFLFSFYQGMGGTTEGRA